MMPKHALSAIDLMLRDIIKSYHHLEANFCSLLEIFGEHYRLHLELSQLAYWRTALTGHLYGNTSYSTG